MTSVKTMAATATRAPVAGAELRVLLLAAESRGCIGVDLSSGAFVRAVWPDTIYVPMSPFDVGTATVAAQQSPPDGARPELVEIETPPRSAERLRLRRAERLLRPLLHPRRPPILGFVGPAVPYWTLTGDRPSVSLVDVELGPHVVRHDWGLACRFAWAGEVRELPLVDHTLGRVLSDVGEEGVGPGYLEAVLGFRPRRLVVALTAPHDGYCYKAVAGLLPRP